MGEKDRKRERTISERQRWEKHRERESHREREA